MKGERKMKVQRKILFPKRQEILYGGDYNPEQWLAYPDILEKDIEMMKEAGVNAVTLGVFSWAAYEPEEGKVDFSWLDQVIDRLWNAGISFILATPTGARPAWMDQKYPEVMRVDDYGVRNHHGFRHNHCMSSEVYREKARKMDQMLAERYGSHPGLLLWHISNEYGGECFCDKCQKKFREYLKKKYKTIENLNACWWTTFWSHTFRDFEEIEAPMKNGETKLPILSQEWRRFTSANSAEFMQEEINTVRKYSPGVPVTTNFMWMFKDLDYREFSKSLDVISWDAYPRWHNDFESVKDTADWTAFNHSIMRSLKPGQPFMLMESTPSLVNWQPFNKLKRPGMTKLAAMQTVACGGDSVLYFQWRKGRGGYEQYHGAVVDHDGRSDARVFREAAETAEMLQELREVLGTVVKAEVAVIYDWNNLWALDKTAGMSQERNYNETCFSWYQALARLGIEADVIGPEDDLSGYKAVIAPEMYVVREGLGQKFTDYVKNGGCLIATYITGYVNENLLCYLGGFPGDGLKELFGVRASELDSLYPSDRNRMMWQGKEYEIRDYCEILKEEGGKALAVYGDDFYQGSPAVTENCLGAGKAYYVGCRTEKAFLQDFLAWICSRQGVDGIQQMPEGVSRHVRTDGDTDYCFYLNFSDEEKEADGVKLPPVSGKMIRRKREESPA